MDSKQFMRTLQRTTISLIHFVFKTELSIRLINFKIRLVKLKNYLENQNEKCPQFLQLNLLRKPSDSKNRSGGNCSLTYK